jgi:hypothetical protein
LRYQTGFRNHLRWNSKKEIHLIIKNKKIMCNFTARKSTEVMCIIKNSSNEKAQF